MSSERKSLSRSALWARVFAAEYPMVELHTLLATDDRSRRALALKIVRSPEQVAEAFAQTVAAIGSYAGPHGFGDPRAARDPAGSDREDTPVNDLGAPLASRPRTAVDTSALRGVAPGELDLVFLDREVELARTPAGLREGGVADPDLDLKADVLVAAPDGTIGVGEIKIGPDRDLFSALIQALAGVALVASPAQISRIWGSYALPAAALPPGPAPKLDAILIAVPRHAPNSFLTQLDVLARGFVPELLAQPQIAGVVRQIVSLTGELVGDDLQLTAKWVERS